MIMIGPFRHVTLSSDHDYATCYNTSKGGNFSKLLLGRLMRASGMTSHLQKTQENSG